MLLREYETIYILRPDLADDGMAQVNDRMTGILDREGAKLLRKDVWGKKKLAYELKKHPKGIYVHLSYLGEPTSVREIERNLRLLEPVLTYQTIKVAENVDAEKRLAEAEAENQARAAAEARRQAEAEAAAAEREAYEAEQAADDEALDEESEDSGESEGSQDADAPGEEE